MIPIVTPVIVYQRDCPRCGQKVGRGHLSCPHCGNQLPRSSRSNVFVILGLLIVLIGGLVMFSRYI